MKRKISLHLLICLSITSCNSLFALPSADLFPATTVIRVESVTAGCLEEARGTQHVTIIMGTTAPNVTQDRLETLRSSVQTTVPKRIGLWAKTTSRTPFLPFMMNGA